MDISVIIPVFNAKRYLERCIQSVTKSLRNFGGKSEILLVDNMSTDGSYEMAQKLAKKSGSNIPIRVMRCETPGAGAARNFAVTEAKGKYFWFVDADDAVSEDAVAKLMQEARRRDADFVMVGLKKIYPDGHTEHVPAFKPERADFRSRFIRSQLGPVQVLIRRKWYTEHNFRFIEGAMHEDMEMMPALMLYTDKIGAVDEDLYFYYQNPGSTLHKQQWSPRVMDIFPALEGLERRFRVAKAEEKYHDELEWFFVWNLLMDSAEYFGKFPEGKEGFARSRAMLRSYYPKWYKNKFYKNTNFKTRLKILANYFR